MILVVLVSLKDLGGSSRIKRKSRCFSPPKLILGVVSHENVVPLDDNLGILNMIHFNY